MLRRMFLITAALALSSLALALPAAAANPQVEFDTTAGKIKVMDAEEVSRRKQSWRSGNGAFLGGFFSTRSQLGPGCRFTTIAHEPAYHDYSTGFRCCANPIGVESPPAPKKKRRGSLDD